MTEPIIPSQEAEKRFGSISCGRDGKRNVLMLVREVPDSLAEGDEPQGPSWDCASN